MVVPPAHCPQVKAEASTLQSEILPVMDWIANVMFTFDMLLGMTVLGLRSPLRPHQAQTPPGSTRWPDQGGNHDRDAIVQPP